ncbi:nucleoside 2-deoxyribosyltransferase [Allorhizobium terrae]|uniref:Nucleoside 2-deoxyribosyltransferase n=1 Tax=Allorhizobium terrae TaxID=1848972 RepID=A0A4S3ZYG3_9HYPH|nr:nucleoside 2-deoxyribosyltransferase [Allorhizobium terrae]THF50983.1 nucleoside 2-deoxyribosyltransferase [Allorhizobium terrae]TWD55228.1 nucleoside 2-deoxyribosyltransferase [Agrobacterium vitis]
MPLKLYLAGPEVFLPNAREILDAKAAMTRSYGFEPICPGDISIEPAPTLHEFGLKISAVDEGMMNAADGVIANLTPFRGIAADPGTAFELGYMCAQGKLVAAYTNIADNHYARTADFYHGEVREAQDGRKRGPDGMSLENFDMIENLMLHGGVERRGGPIAIHNAAIDGLYTDLTAFEQCLKALQKQTHQNKPASI